MQELGSRIEAAIEKVGGQAVLAERAGISEATIRRYRAGDDPKLSVLVKIAEAAGMPLSMLIFGEPVPSQAFAQLREVGDNGDHIMVVDIAVLAEIIESVDDALAVKKVTLTAKKKAQLIAVFYSYFASGEFTRDQAEETLGGLIDLAN